MNRTAITTEAKAWIKRSHERDGIVRIVPEEENDDQESYNLFSAYEHDPEYLGRILFDKQGYWIYDGQTLSVTEQEQLVGFIIHYKGAV